MSKSRGVRDEIRNIMVAFKYDKINLGDAMRQVAVILKKTNGDFYYKGKIRKAIEYKMEGYGTNASA